MTSQSNVVSCYCRSVAQQENLRVHGGSGARQEGPHETQGHLSQQTESVAGCTGSNDSASE